MKNIIESAKDFKITPENFKSSCGILVSDIDDKKFIVKKDDNKTFDVEDFKKDSYVEIFAVNDLGLLYFETKILSNNEEYLEMQMPEDYSIIQRREYLRVKFKTDKINFIDLPEDIYVEIVDISAGGLKIKSNYRFETNKKYKLQFGLLEKLDINCDFEPVRCDTDDDNNKYFVSGKFTNLETMDRIAIVQYAFKLQMEGLNKEK